MKSERVFTFTALLQPSLRKSSHRPEHNSVSSMDRFDPLCKVRFGLNTTVPDKLAALKQILGEIKQFSAASNLMIFDQMTAMPSNAWSGRSQLLATMARLSHEKLTNPEVGALLRQLTEPEQFKQLSESDKALVKKATSNYEKALKLPAAWVERLSKAKSESKAAWKQARDANDFKIFQPHLENLVRLSREKALMLCCQQQQPLYGALLDEYEEGLSVAQMDQIFADLRRELLPLLNQIQASKVTVKSDFRRRPEGTFPVAQQKDFGKTMAEALGFDFRAGTLETVEHPCCLGIDSPHDVRMGTNYNTSDPLVAIFSILHETGHGLYEQGINPSLAGTILASGVSSAVHESQSRLYENIIGRSKAFWQHYFPKVQTAFGVPLKDVSEEDFFRAVNEVTPSLIRVDADEVTYNLHILMRYEIEKGLIDGTIKTDEVPAVWRQKMGEYLGIQPKNDNEGVLQDIQWAMGAFGYFPTYTLGNLMAAQLSEAMKKDLAPKHQASNYLDKQLAQGNFKEIREWLREKIHDAGATASPKDLIETITGEPLNAKYFIQYLRDKYAGIYPNLQSK